MGGQPGFILSLQMWHSDTGEWDSYLLCQDARMPKGDLWAFLSGILNWVHFRDKREKKKDLVAFYGEPLPPSGDVRE